MVFEPLHPIVVHFPIVLAVLLPISAAIALWAIRRGTAARKAWIVPVALAVALTGSAWVAVQTGEREEDRVEQYVAEAPIEDHEEAAERFLLFAGLTTLVAGVGLFGGVLGRAARLVASAGTVVVLAAGVLVGAAGGALVYEHGAAEAYLQAPAHAAPFMGGSWSDREAPEDR